MQQGPRLARVITLGSDAHMLDRSSRQRERLRTYARLADNYVALIVARVPEVIATTEGNLTIIALPKGRPLHAYRFLARFFISDPAELRTGTVLSAQDPFELGVIGFLLAKRFGWRFHVQIHTALFSPRFRGESFRTRLQSLIALFVLPRARGIRVVSRPLRDELVARGYDERRIVVAPVIEPLPERIRDAAYAGGTIEIVSVARFVPVKNLPSLIEGFAAFAAKHDARLTLVGGGPLESVLRGQARRTGIADRVAIVPWTDDLGALYLKSHLAALVSYYEGFGMAIIEALGHGVPVVITHLQGAEEYVADGVNGVIAEGFDGTAIAAALERAAEKIIAVSPADIRASLRVPTKEETDALLVSSWRAALDLKA